MDMTDEQALISEIHKLPVNKQAEAFDAVLRLIKSFAKQTSEDAAKKRPPRKAGSRPGAYIMSPDFDEPLEDFKEYR